MQFGKDGHAVAMVSPYSLFPIIAQNFGNLYLGTLGIGNLLLGNLGNLYFGTLGMGGLGAFLENFANFGEVWKPLLGNLGNLYFTWELWEPLLRNLGNLYLGTVHLYLGTLGTFGTLRKIGFGAAPVCSETFTMAEDPKASAVKEFQPCLQLVFVTTLETPPL